MMMMVVVVVVVVVKLNDNNYSLTRTCLLVFAGVNYKLN